MKQQAFNPPPSLLGGTSRTGSPTSLTAGCISTALTTRFNGHAYCLNDYVTWSPRWTTWATGATRASSTKKTQDPTPTAACAFTLRTSPRAPTAGTTSTMCWTKKSVVSVAVCDSPARKFQFQATSTADGTLLGEQGRDEPQFTRVLYRGGTPTCCTGFCFAGDKSRHAPCARYWADMLTIRQEPVFIAPSQPHSQGSGFEGHEFFEAPSIRRQGTPTTSSIPPWCSTSCATPPASPHPGLPVA